MKKTYIEPALELMQTEVQQMLAASIVGVSGDINDITKGGEDTEGMDADVKGNFFGGSIFEE